MKCSTVLLIAMIAYEEAAATRNSMDMEKMGKKSKKKSKSKSKSKVRVSLGPRPYYIVDSMKDSDLKAQLVECAQDEDNFKPTDWSIGHRGACMQFPEHTLISYKAALTQGAGIVECDVTFTKDAELICRHAQCDLHTTTDVLLRPALAAKCTTPFVPGEGATCCASDFTLAEIKTLCAKMDASVADAMTPEEYVGGTPGWRTDLYSAECPEVPTHKESINLIKAAGARFTPELKAPAVEMPFASDVGTFTLDDYRQKLIDEYIAAGVPPKDVWQQSFNWDDVVYWMVNTDFEQAVAVDGGDDLPATQAEFDALAAQLTAVGVKYIAPPLWKLVGEQNGAIIASAYAAQAKEAGFKIITWAIERSGPLSLKPVTSFYYQTVPTTTTVDGDMFELLHVLAKDVEIEGIFSDWPATTTFFANCMGL